MKVEATNGYEGEKKPPGAKRKGEKLVRKRGCSRGTRRRVQAASTAIQRLYVACKMAFKDPKTVPDTANVEMLQLLLGIAYGYLLYCVNSASWKRPKELKLQLEL
ncbi:hypothetical protein BHE74_00041465 [Ensete ventricosum]|uniref:Uncharacterized protein n=1 Tax=Ensete ventricosum TaxID=4639 RepID=A0A444GII1_ENSVE|nr:hypothetical protein B296_00038385 [Ensete ventricosum]RWW34663.1 hypothetical protein GW17_00000575 [Ensete ventricosum]RWW52133.1 hypothetical protein BHE74_00041465 [Ensete ventricosum]RZS01365.1 hypothetical protein BHM03_00031209 [Ensete ventricosum]